MSERNAKVKLVDVAKAANVSITTASLALSNRKEISDETRKRVIQAKNKLGYEPLRRRSPEKTIATKQITRLGFLLVEGRLSDEAYSIAVHNLQDISAKMDIRLEIAAIENISNPDEVIDTALNFAKDLDGLILSNHISRELIHNIHNTGTPFIVIGSYEELSDDKPDMNVCSIDSDMIAMGHMAARHLIKAGHERIAFICEELPKGQLNYRWLLGLKAALEDASLPVNPDYIQVSGQAFAGGEPAAQAFSEMQNPPTAYIIPDIRIAGQFVMAMKLRGKDVDPTSFVIHGNEELPRRYQVEKFPRIETNKLIYQVAVEKLCEICKSGMPYPYKLLLPFKAHNGSTSA